MRAVGVTEFGGPEALNEVDVDEPHAGPEEVRIAVRAASVVPADGLFRNGALAARLTTPPPWIPGTEIAGVVDEAADGAPWKVGDEVVAIVVPFHQRPGGYAERVVVPVGSTLAVTGAGGVVGGMVLQLAKRVGATVIADAPGGDALIDRATDYAPQIRRLYPDGVDVVVDAALMGQSLLGAVRDGGRAASLRAGQLEPERDISVTSVSVWDYATDGARLAALASLVDDGQLVLPPVRPFPAEEAAAAHELLGKRGQRGRSVLLF
jgi:NADPH:quinone reductase